MVVWDLKKREIKENLKRIPGNISPDTRRRVHLPKVIKIREDVIYHIWANSEGQIVLDPHVPIPVSEAWLFENPEILSLVKRGLSEAAEDKFSEIDLDTL